MTMCKTKLDKAVKVANKMLDYMNKTHRTGLATAWIGKEGKQVFTDGFRMYRMEEPLPIETTPNDDQRPNVESLFKPVYEKTNKGCYVRIECPKEADLRKFIREQKAEAKAKNGRNPVGVMYHFGKMQPVVNAQYVLDMMVILQNPEVYTLDTTERFLAPLYFKSEYGEALLLPIRCADEEEYKKEADC